MPQSDLAVDKQYPRWARRVVDETGLRSSLSFQLFTSEDTLGALNLYAPRPDAFSHDDRTEGLLFAAHAAMAVQNAQTEQDLRSAISSRTVIGRAEGILMERYKITGERAFDILRSTSQRHNIKLRDLAAEITDTGTDPS